MRKLSTKAVLILLLLVGCQSSIPLKVTLMSTAEHRVTPTWENGNGEETSPTGPVGPPAKEATLKPQPSPTIENGCTISINSLEEGKITEGVIIYESSSTDQVLKTLPAHPDISIPFLNQFPCCIENGLGDDAISRDHQWIVLKNSIIGKEDQDIIVVTQNDLDPYVINEEDIGAVNIIQWLNSEQILLYPTSEAYPTGTLVAYNPFLRKSQIIQPKFPNLVDPGLFRPRWWFDAPEVPVYDPSMTKVVYYSIDMYSFDEAIIYWDLLMGTELWKKEVHPPTSSLGVTKPQWSPDGSRFALFTLRFLRGSPFDLMIVDREGNEKVLSDPQIAPPIEEAGGLGWSPDGKYLAFYIQKEEVIRLLIYDTETEEIWDPCIHQPLGSNEYPVFAMGTVSWSPSGRYFLVKQWETNSDKFSYLVDVYEKEIYDFSIDYVYALWLTE